MNGYFSRLIEQSGIATRPAAGRASALPARLPARIDPEAPVEPRGEEQIFETRKGPEAASEAPGRIVEELVQDPAERVLHRGTPEPPDLRSSGRRQSETSEGGAPGPRASERTPPQRTGDAGDLPARVDAVEAHKGVEWPVSSIREVLELDETVEGATHRPDERSPSDVGVPGEAPASLPHEEPRDRGGRELAWRSTFEEVRGWVAESGDGEAEDVSRAATSVDADVAFVEGRRATSPPGPVVTSSPREEPGTRDLRLEIGTISVTVEEPRREVPEIRRRAEVPEKKPAGRGERSRLSRHYVRVG